jgi:hypothetical protein
MLLQDWRKFNEAWNPKKLKFSKWLEEPQTLFRGIPQDSLEVNATVLQDKPFYSFSFLEHAAKRFTSPNYASGAWTPVRQLNGIIVKAEVKPKDFHIYRAFCSDDEMEVIVKSPINVEFYASVKEGKVLKSSDAEAA